MLQFIILTFYNYIYENDLAHLMNGLIASVLLHN